VIAVDTSHRCLYHPRHVQTDPRVTLRRRLLLPDSGSRVQWLEHKRDEPDYSRQHADHDDARIDECAHRRHVVDCGRDHHGLLHERHRGHRRRRQRQSDPVDWVLDDHLYRRDLFSFDCSVECGLVDWDRANMDRQYCRRQRSVVITSLSSTAAVGTFSFSTVAAVGGATGTHAITQGVFNITF
jgi:hypothetical protein